MTNTINTLLSTYGFRPTRLGEGMTWGFGSICNGMTVTVTIEDGLLVITTHTFYCDGVVEEDTTKVVRCRLSHLWENLPEVLYRYQR